jgi:hypothetical protein
MGFKLSKLGRRLVQHFDARAIRQKLKSQKLEIMGPVLLDISTSYYHKDAKYLKQV